MSELINSMKLSSTEEKALKLLGSGVSSESVAAAVGVTPARISQLLSDENFKNAVAELRCGRLEKYTQRDSEYDEIEDKLLEKYKKSLPFMVKPVDILKAIQVINGAKRRGQDNTDGAAASTKIVQIAMPTSIVQNFTTNINNHVVRAGEQELTTMQSGTLLDKIKEERAVLEHEEQNQANKLEASKLVGDQDESSRSKSLSKSIEEYGL